MSEHLNLPDPKPTARRTAAAEPARAHVLIVDDHALSRDIYAGYCDLFDHTSRSAAGGAGSRRGAAPRALPTWW